MILQDSAKLSDGAAASIRAVFQKAGGLRVELYDKRAALESLVKILQGDDVATRQNITVNTVNVGAIDAMDAARSIAFLLQAAAHAGPPPQTIEGHALVATPVPDKYGVP